MPFDLICYPEMSLSYLNHLTTEGETSNGIINIIKKYEIY